MVPATGRPLLSVPYMFNYGQPFTHIGVLVDLAPHRPDQHLQRCGQRLGPRHHREPTSTTTSAASPGPPRTRKANIAISTIAGPQEYPRFLPTQHLYPADRRARDAPAVLRPRQPVLRRQRPLDHVTTVLTYKWTDKFTQVIETDQSFEKNVPFSAPITARNPLGRHNAEWYSFGNWFLWQFWKKDDRDIMTAVWRSEVFRDNNGVRTGFADNFYEMTLGFIIKPKPYIWIRPEVRYDWAQFTHPYTDGTRNSQFTIGVDAILLF